METGACVLGYSGGLAAAWSLRIRAQNDWTLKGQPKLENSEFRIKHSEFRAAASLLHSKFKILHKAPMSRISEDQRLLLIAALKAFKPAVVYVFGSFGTPSQHQGSDIDIAFLPTVVVDPMDCFRIAGQLAEPFGRHVDLVNLAEASTVFSKEVLRTGIPIAIESPALQQQFEMLTLADYARLNEERQAVLAS